MWTQSGRGRPAHNTDTQQHTQHTQTYKKSTHKMSSAECAPSNPLLIRKTAGELLEVTATGERRPPPQTHTHHIPSAVVLKARQSCAAAQGPCLETLPPPTITTRRRAATAAPAAAAATTVVMGVRQRREVGARDQATSPSAAAADDVTEVGGLPSWSTGFAVDRAAGPVVVVKSRSCQSWHASDSRVERMGCVENNSV